jgi:nicotinamide riboside kinase
MIKIAITGPESSGKTTLAKGLSELFQVSWHPEYARKYLEKQNGEYVESDLLHIALNQDEIRSNLSSQDQIQIFDTENTVIKIWSSFKYKRVSPEILNLQQTQVFDHYFLCSPENIDWEDDPLREHPEQRAELFAIYLEELEKLNVPFTLLKGSAESRLEQAAEIIEELSMSSGGFCV